MMDHWQRAELEHLVELMQGGLAGSPSHIATEQLLQQCLCRIPQEAAADAGAAEKRQRRVALADEEAAAARAHADEVAARADAWEAELCRLRAARGEVVTVVPSTPHSPCNAIAAAAAQPASLLHRSLQLHSLAQAIWLAAPLAAEGDLGVTTKDVNEDTNALGSLHQGCMAKAEDFEAETTSRGEELKALAMAKKAEAEKDAQLWMSAELRLAQLQNAAHLQSSPQWSMTEAMKAVESLREAVARLESDFAIRVRAPSSSSSSSSSLESGT